MVQWLRPCTSKAGGAGSTLGQGNKISHTAWHGKKKKKRLEREKSTFKKAYRPLLLEPKVAY